MGVCRRKGSSFRRCRRFRPRSRLNRIIGVGIGIAVAIGFGIDTAFRFPISTAIPVCRPLAMLPFGMVGGANQWPRSHVPETQGYCLIAQFRKLGRGIKAFHRQMISGRLQVLSQCQDVHFLPRKILQHFDKLAALLAQPKHQT